MSKKGGHHGGSWKVAYADFVTAMMALFLCLWLTSQDQKIKDSVERAFRNPFSSVTKESNGIIPSKDSSSTTAKGEGKFQSVSAVEIETMKHISEDLAKILQQQDETQNSIKIEMTPDGLRINIFDRSQKPIFEADTDMFTSYGSWVFSTLAWEISRYTTFKIELEGHTAAKAEGGSEKGEGGGEKAQGGRDEKSEVPASAASYGEAAPKRSEGGKSNASPPTLGALASAKPGSARPRQNEMEAGNLSPLPSPLSPRPDAWSLSTERANSARRKLVQSGVGAAQICKVSGYADGAPMPDLPPTAEANRRVTVLLKLKESTDALNKVASDEARVTSDKLDDSGSSLITHNSSLKNDLPAN